MIRAISRTLIGLQCLLNNFPRWTYRNKDMVICMDELKLGLLAYNCTAPGFSTLMLNLLNGHRMKHANNKVSTSPVCSVKSGDKL